MAEYGILEHSPDIPVYHKTELAEQLIPDEFDADELQSDLSAQNITMS